MTVFIAPSPPPAADVGLPAPKLELSLDRGSNAFGPALAEARAQLDNRATRRQDQPADDSPRNDDRSTQRSRPSSGESERVENDERPADTPADQSSDGEVESEETAAATETTDTETEEAVATETALLGLLDVQPDHPTAKGADGDGAPSTDPRVEGVASPNVDDAEQLGLAASDAPVVADGRNTMATEMTDGSSLPGDAVETLQQAETGADDGLAGLAENSGEQELMTGATASDQSGQDERSETDSESADDAARLTLTDDAAAEHDQLDATDTARTVDTRSTELVGQTQATDAASRAAGAERVVVQATEAIATEATTNPEVTFEMPGDAAAAAEADTQLWRDVRAAFERVKTTGEAREIRMRLHPAELGELIVQVRTQGDQVSVRLVASTAAAHQALIDDRLRLAAELARAGFDEGTVDIGQQSASSDQQDANPDPRSFDEPDRTLGLAGSVSDRTDRDVFERRDPVPILPQGRPGRTAVSTINLTL